MSFFVGLSGPLQDTEPEAHSPWLGFLFLALFALLLLPLGLRLLAALSAHPGVRCPWGNREALFVFLAGFSSLLLASEVLGTGTTEGALLATAVGLGCTSAVAIGIAFLRGGVRAMGFSVPGAGDLLRSLGGYFLAFPAILTLGAAWALLAESMGLELGVQPVLEGIVHLEGAQLVLAAAIAVVAAPAFEEILFRGFLQPLVVGRLGARLGIAVTSVLFALLHPPVAQPPVFALSLLLGWLSYRSRSLLGPWLVHGVHNGITLLIGLQAPRWVS